MMSLAEAAAVLGARMRGGDARFSGVSTDSRTLRRGELFVALRGERFDGHGFLQNAAAAKAAAALVDSQFPGDLPLQRPWSTTRALRSACSRGTGARGFARRSSR